jgi:hypothetical protein
MGLTKDRFCHSGVIDTAVTNISDFIVNFLREFKAILKKAFTCVGRVGWWKNQRSKILCQGPFKSVSIRYVAQDDRQCRLFSHFLILNDC